MQGRPGRRPRQHLRDTSLDLSQEDRTRLVNALRFAKSLDGAARSYGMTDLVGFRRLATREGFGPLVRPLVFPLRHLSQNKHRTLLRWIQQGKPATAIAKVLGVRRQAVEQRIARLGLWAAYKLAREAAKARRQGVWEMVSAPPYRGLLPIAAALTARGVTVGCVPVFDSRCQRVVDCRLIADGAPVRVLRPHSLWQGRYRVDVRDLSSHYVIETPDGWRLWYAVGRGTAGQVFIPEGGAPGLLNTRHPPAAVWRVEDHPDPWAGEPTGDPGGAELGEDDDGLSDSPAA